MKRNTFRELKSCLLLLCCIVFLLSACGNDKNLASSPKVSEDVNQDNLTRGEYLALVGEYFGYDNYEATDDFFPDVSVDDEFYNYIQACAEWDVVQVDGNFHSEEEATMEFALATAVRAIGLDELQDVDTNAGNQALAEYYINNIAQLDENGYGRKGITKSIARQVLQYALEYGNEIELPQYVDTEYAPGVKEANAKIMLPLSGNTGVLYEGHGYQVEDIVYFEDTPMGYPRGIKITSITDEKFTFEDVSVEEVFSKLELFGTFDGEIVNVFSASDNVGAYEEEIYYPADMSMRTQGYSLLPIANGVKVDKGKNHVTFVAYVSEGNSKAEFRLGISNIKVTVAYRHGSTVLQPEDVKLNVAFDTEMDALAEFHGSKTIPLGSIDINVWGPMFVKMSLVANIGADGEMELNYTIHNTANAEWKKGKGVNKGFTSSTNSTFEGNITLVTEMTAMADLVIKFMGEHSILNAQVTSGVVMIARMEADLLGNQPTCIDILGYVPLRWGINQKGCLVSSINGKWRMKGVIWDSKTSKFIMHRHLEDYVRTPDDKCTRGAEDEIVLETEKSDGTPVDEYEYFSFEPISFDFIHLKEYVSFLDMNGQAEIAFESIPEGYSENSLIYTVENPSVCMVQRGKIIALEAGTTLIKISTQDGMFSVSLAVIVNDDYSISADFEAL